MLHVNKPASNLPAFPAAPPSSAPPTVHPAIHRIFGNPSEADKHPTLQSRLDYSRQMLIECLDKGWNHAAEGWRETLQALERQGCDQVGTLVEEGFNQ